MKKFLFVLTLFLMPFTMLFAVDGLPDVPGGLDLSLYVRDFLTYVASVLVLTEILSLWIKFNRQVLIWILSAVVGGAAFILGYGVFDAWYFSVANIAIAGAILNGYLTAGEGKLIIDLLRGLLERKKDPPLNR